MRKALLCFVILAIVFGTVSFSKSAEALVDMGYILEIKSDDIPLLLQLDKEAEDLVAQAEEIVNVYSTTTSLEKRNACILDLMFLLENIEMPILCDRLPDLIKYDGEERYLTVSWNLDDNASMEYSIHMPSEISVYFLKDGGYYSEPTEIVSDAVSLYSSTNKEETNLRKEKVYVWQGYLCVNDYPFLCEYTSTVDNPSKFAPNEIMETIGEAPIATIEEVALNPNRALRRPVDVRTTVMLSVVVVEAVAIVVMSVVLLREPRSKKSQQA